MSILTQRDWDIAQVESQLRVQMLFAEWLNDLLRGRNPYDQVANMTPEQINQLMAKPEEENGIVYRSKG